MRQLSAGGVFIRVHFLFIRESTINSMNPIPLRNDISIKNRSGKLAMANSVRRGSGLLALSKNGTSPQKGGGNG
jgi:hypothetical protein